MKDMTLQELCSRIDLPGSVADVVMQTRTNLDMERLQPAMKYILDPSRWYDGLDQLKEQLNTEDEGMQMLTVMLTAALDSYREYQNKGISDDIFNDTFACFTRFVKEHMVSYQQYGFDREWWTIRQLSLRLFRIGTLEYEIISVGDDLELSLHIPSDSILTIENCRTSYEMAQQFFAQFYPEVKSRRISCESWLLAPGLQEVLGKDSHILTFQKSFEVSELFPEDKGYLEWAFQRCQLPVDQLPERTALQRNLKAYLMKGNKLGAAFGYLIDEPFC